MNHFDNVRELLRGYNTVTQTRKEELHQVGKVLFEQVAEDLNLSPSAVHSFPLSSGISGFITLRGMFAPTQGIFVQLSGETTFGAHLLVRPISHLYDREGGQTHYILFGQKTAPRVSPNGPYISCRYANSYAELLDVLKEAAMCCA